MTAARLKAIEKLEPSKMPVMTVSGRIAKFYAQEGPVCAPRLNFGDCALDRNAHAI